MHQKTSNVHIHGFIQEFLLSVVHYSASYISESFGEKIYIRISRRFVT